MNLESSCHTCIWQIFPNRAHRALGTYVSRVEQGGSFKELF